ncbi:MAG: DNA polymerase III subunit epsilon [Gammaproteobacteria bacterium]|nr:DNA polymerase III subunit epsilon [Gammaproteobacteria bacterium]
MRQIILDTETSGLELSAGHRVIEIGCVEIVNRRLTGRHFHRYLDPERDIDPGALAVHGLSRERLKGEPRFVDVAAEFMDFVAGAELVIHNAAFDVGFLNAEIARLEGEHPPLGNLCRVLDTLALARELHPGQRNNLDALCKRYGVDNSSRDLHGALLDARILAEVYLAMTGGQSALELGESRTRTAATAPVVARPAGELPIIEPTATELAAHEALLDRIAKASGGRCLFRDAPAA